MSWCCLTDDKIEVVCFFFWGGGGVSDVEMMKRASEETPLEEGIHLTFQRMPVHSAPSSVVHVRGLSPTTSDEAIRMYFSNKRRNGGGPVENVERISYGSAALVYFSQPQGF